MHTSIIGSSNQLYIGYFKVLKVKKKVFFSGMNKYCFYCSCCACKMSKQRIFSVNISRNVANFEGSKLIISSRKQCSRTWTNNMETNNMEMLFYERLFFKDFFFFLSFVGMTSMLLLVHRQVDSSIIHVWESLIVQSMQAIFRG